MTSASESPDGDRAPRDSGFRFTEPVSAAPPPPASPDQATAAGGEPVMLLLDFLENCYSVERDLKPSTIRMLQDQVQAYSSWLNRPATLGDLCGQTVNQHLIWLSDRGRAPSTILTRRRVLLTLWRAAWEAELLSTLPRRIRKVTLPRHIPDAWTPEEVRRLVQACRETTGRLRNGLSKPAYWSSLVLAAWDSALRLGDLLSLEAERVTGDGRFTVMQNKTGFEQPVTLRPSTLAAVAECIASCPGRREIWAWPSRREEFYKAFARIVKRAGIRNGTFRWLRRGSVTAVDVIKRGAGTDHAGHRDRSTTVRHYIDQRQYEDDRPAPPDVSELNARPVKVVAPIPESARAATPARIGRSRVSRTFRSPRRTS